MAEALGCETSVATPATSEGHRVTIVDVLRARAATAPQRTAYTFLEGEAPPSQISYGELLARAEHLAATLRQRGAAGERVMIVLPPGLDYIVALFACFLGRLVAVPTYPPRPRRSPATLRLICEDCAPAALVASPAVASQLARDWPELRIPLVTPSSGKGAPSLGSDPSADELALLQYTSGSTGRPKGVMLRHANLMDNLERQRRLYRAGPESRGVIWLPPYHDMGLGSGILQPPYADSQIVLLSPLHAMQRPLRWLRAIHETRATVSGGPPFAYAACVDTITAEDLAQLDLSSWTCAFVGAEPIASHVLDRFAETFAPCGFRRESFQPSYGLAEATLLVAGGEAGEGPRAHAAQRGQPAPRVSCGRAVGGHEVRIVDAASKTVMDEGQAGEIWIRGPSVAAGYWNDPVRSEEVFAARLRNGEGPFLRTGDLGVMIDGELCVTGRAKDVIVLAGRKLHAEDVESAVTEAEIPGVRAAALAAFGVDIHGEERLVVMAEVRGMEAGAEAAVRQAVAAAVSRSHDARVHDVKLVRPGSLPRTSSGKVRRHLCRDDYLAGEAVAT